MVKREIITKTAFKAFSIKTIERSGSIAMGASWFLWPCKIFRLMKCTVALYGEEPLVSGYISDENREKLPGTRSVLVSKLGTGRDLFCR